MDGSYGNLAVCHDLAISWYSAASEIRGRLAGLKTRLNGALECCIAATVRIIKNTAPAV